MVVVEVVVMMMMTDFLLLFLLMPFFGKNFKGQYRIYPPYVGLGPSSPQSMPPLPSDVSEVRRESYLTIV